MARANGERGKYVGRGRFAEKGGQQVAPFFESSAHNEKIKHLYGNYNWWSWFRYWYLDSVNQITMLLIDKGYYDYDYEQAKTKVAQLLYEDTVKSDADTSNLLAKFGIGVAKPEEQTMEDLQQLAMKELKELK